MRRWSIALAVVLVASLAVLESLRPEQQTRAPVDPVPGAPRDEPAQAGAPENAVPTASGSNHGEASRITLLGEVVDDEGYEPLEGVRVRLGHVPPPVQGTSLAQDDPGEWFASDPVTQFVEERVTGPDGKFTFSVGSVRGWAIIAIREGLGDAVYVPHELELTTGKTEVTLTIVLARGEPVRLRVVDTSDRPVPGATVARYDGSCDRPPSEILRTDEDGWFETAASKHDVVVVRAEGFARHVEDGILDRAGARIVLTEAFPLGGIVVGGGGEPIEGALVWTDLDGYPPRVTDAGGRFIWDDLALETRDVEITARAADRLPGWAHTDPGQTDVRIVLNSPGSVTGRFVFPAGAGAHPVRLEVLGPGSFRHRSMVDSPEFRVVGVPPSTLSLEGEAYRRVRALGRDHSVLAFRGRLEVERLRGADLEGVELRLEPVDVSHVVIRVVNSEGHPIKGAGHTVSAPYGGGKSGDSNAEGLIWSAVALSPGTSTKVSVHAVVRVHDGTQLVRKEDVPVRTAANPGSEPVEIVLSLDPARQANTVRLILYSERADGRQIPPEAGAHWRVSQRGKGMGRGPAVIPPGPGGGRWRGEQIIDAGMEHDVVAWANGYARRRFELPAFEPGDVEFVCRLKPESRVQGRLVTPAGLPARQYSIEVLVRPPGEPSVRAGRSPRGIGEDGRFTLGSVPAGPARISVIRSDGTIVAETTRSVPEATTVDIGDMVLGALPLLKATVMDADGRPLGAARVELFEVGHPISYARSLTREDGRFELAAPLRTNAVIRIGRDPEFAPYFAALSQAMCDAPRKVRLSAPVTAIVEIHTPPAGIELRRVTAFDVATGHPLERVSGATRAGSGLRWTLHRLPIGSIRFRLVGTGPDGTSWEAEARGTMESGRTTNVLLEREE